ncbi:MAG: hypothetical protein AOA66_1765 [Candidatus Bathyarchaeota archaeon BA2]|nr:MAG: hypothetical protein AOA66_1765 [Candidatus Bathyarchaeota archaeon BA2]
MRIRRPRKTPTKIQGIALGSTNKEVGRAKNTRRFKTIQEHDNLYCVIELLETPESTELKRNAILL